MTAAGLPIRPEQLIALNEEIATLVMAGVPLELGLRAFGGDVPSVLSRISHEVANQLQQGQSLSNALQKVIPGLPRVYIATVEAGLKAGELPRTLELLSRFVQQGLDLRQRIEFAFLYPFIVFLLAYSLFATCAIESARRWDEIWGEPALEQSSLIAGYRIFCEYWPLWVWIPPAIIFLIFVGWFSFGRRSLLPDRSPSFLLRVVPGLRGIVVMWHWSIFCESAAMLIERQVALPTTLRLAGAATGNSVIDSEMTRLAENLERGQSAADSLREARQIPQFVRWVLASASHTSILLNGLKHAAGLYHQRATRRADVIKTWLPLALIVLIGGGAVLVYALSCVLPVLGLLEELRREGDQGI